jgi:hypothetical protein
MGGLKTTPRLFLPPPPPPKKEHRCLLNSGVRRPQRQSKQSGWQKSSFFLRVFELWTLQSLYQLRCPIANHEYYITTYFVENVAVPSDKECWIWVEGHVVSPEPPSNMEYNPVPLFVSYPKHENNLRFWIVRNTLRPWFSVCERWPLVPCLERRKRKERKNQILPSATLDWKTSCDCRVRGSRRESPCRLSNSMKNIN